ncbi:MAG: hypothetical protein GY760_10790 [Deltaproteobacteria bacterium]|nr:hypothetical protein [Deltaproteobacteria bacterium]
MIYLEISNEDSGLFMYTVSITYPNTKKIEKLDVELVADNLIECEKTKNKLFKKEVEKLHKGALEARFSHASLEEKKDFTPHYHKKYPVNFHKRGRNITISEKSLYRKLLQIS